MTTAPLTIGVLATRKTTFERSIMLVAYLESRRKWTMGLIFTIESLRGKESLRRQEKCLKKSKMARWGKFGSSGKVENGLG